MTRVSVSGAERAAIFMLLLDDDEAAGLLTGLSREELQRLGASMVALGDIEPGNIAEAVADFAEQAADESLPATDRSHRVHRLMTRALGPVKGDSIMAAIGPDTRPKSVEFARWLAPSVLERLVAQEHPQVIAVLLLMIDPDPAAQLLSLLPSELQPRVVERIARLGGVSAQAVAMLDQILTTRIEDRFGPEALTLGGAREAANLINLAAGAVGKTVLPDIETRDADLAQAIEAELLTFDMLFELEPLAMGRLLRDVESNMLVDALKGLDEDARAPFFSAMSSRAADGVRDDIETRGRIRKDEVESAQRGIVDIARNLADAGEIVLGADDGEFV